MEPESKSAMVGAHEVGEPEQTSDFDDFAEAEPATNYTQSTESPETESVESVGISAPADFERLGRIRDPGFHPRGQADRARRRSVRRGGSVVVGPGRRSVVIEVPISSDIAGIVANVEPEMYDVRVEAVTVGDGTARVTLNRPAPDAVEVAWYIVSNPIRESS
jgi:hypothetical protein